MREFLSLDTELRACALVLEKTLFKRSIDGYIGVVFILSNNDLIRERCSMSTGDENCSS
jgi:hypothetical protein